MNTALNLNPEAQLTKLGLHVPAAPGAVAAYEPWQVIHNTRNLITTSFQLPWVDGKLAFVGKLGRELSTEQGYAAARICALNGIAQLKSAANGDLKRIRIVRIEGHVGCTEDFPDMPKVLNGGSELINEVFGEQGRHARTALGHMVMPLNVPVMLGFWAELI
jgi:enamine deaminase RidA (YjgF/YER057c/UK114 family)